MKPIKSKKLRDSARGQPCTFDLPGICNHDVATTVLAHLQFDGGVMGSKECDLSACYACSDCHTALDQYKIDADARHYYMGRALARTHKLMARNGAIKI